MLNFKLNEVRLLIMDLNTNENRIPFILIQYIVFVSFSRSSFVRRYRAAQSSLTRIHLQIALIVAFLSTLQAESKHATVIGIHSNALYVHTTDNYHPERDELPRIRSTTSI